MDPRLTARLVLASTTAQGVPERLEDALVAVRVGRLLRRQDRTGTASTEGGR